MATLANSAHPFLKEPVLYVVDPPNRVQWYQLVETFSPCGSVSTVGKEAVEGKPNRRRWPIRFVSIFHAEMALATLQGEYVKSLLPPWGLSLSHSPTFEKATFPEPPLPQYLAPQPGFFSDPTVNAQLLFRCFRNAGPLVSVQTGVNLVAQEYTAVIQYYSEDHANLACAKENMIHSRLRSRPQFSLSSYDPFRLRCSGFRLNFMEVDLRTMFSQFGNIKSIYLNNTRGLDAYGLVTFTSHVCAARALHAMNAARNGHLVVRYQELHAGEGSPKSLSPTQPQQPRSSCSPDSNARDELAEEARAKAEQRRQAAAQEMKEAEEREEREDISRRAAEAKVKDCLDRQLRQEAAERASAWAQREMEIATADRLEACENLARAEQVQNASMQKFIDAERASAEAKRILLEAMLREAEAKQEMESAQSATINARTRVQQADKRFEVANQEEMSSRYEKEKLSRELDEDIVDEEAIRQAELAESIRRMQELRELEEQEMEERARRERHAAEERLSREREEAERVVREQREREEKARRDEAARQQFYQKAARKEQKRCRLRDLTFFPDPYVLTWHEPRVLERFMFVSDEFDTLKFQLEESQPLTFDSIPWPILGHPRGITLEDIDWTAVEKFFSAAEKLLKEKGEYKALVEKAHRRFHPDKWRSRGILNSVLDDDLRGRLEAAGNVVAQAITPLWLKSRE